MRRLAFILAALLVVSPARAADQWNAGTLTGTGRTEALAYPATCSSTTAFAIPRRATSLTNALTRYVTTGAGDLAATSYTPSSPTRMEKIGGVGCDSTRVFVGGSGLWLQYAALVNLASWSFSFNPNATGETVGGSIAPVGTDYRFAYSWPGGSATRVYDLTVPTTTTSLASSAPPADDVELVSTKVSSSFYCVISGEYSSGQPYMRGYTSGASYAFTTRSSSVVMNTGSYFYPPFGLSATACVATVRRVNNAHTYILSAPIGGTIAGVDAGVIDLIPLGDWDPTGSLRRAWWVNKADGTVRVSNSATTVGSISTNATYDIGSTPLGGSTPLFAITGLDMDGDGATANPVVLMADGTHFAWWGTQPAVAASTPKPSPAPPGAGALRSLRRMVP